MPDLLAGELSPAREDRIRSHFERCGDCGAAFARESLVDRALAVWDDEDLPEDALDRIETRIAFAPPAAAEPSRRSVLVPFSAGFATAATLTFALWLFAGESAAPLPAASPRAVSDVTPVPGTRVLEYVDAHNRLAETPMPPEVFEALRRQLGDAEFRAWNDRVRFAPTPVDFEAK